MKEQNTNIWKGYRIPYIENVQVTSILSLKEKLTPDTKIDIIENVPTIVPKTPKDYRQEYIQRKVVSICTLLKLQTLLTFLSNLKEKVIR
jgi:hypothetical protein